MKTTLVIRKLLAGAACVSFLVGSAAMAAGNATYSKNPVDRAAQTAPKERVVLVHVTGSWIPQRVVIAGTQVNSSSPLFVVQGNDLLRSGGSTVQSILSRDPSITFSRAR